MTKQGKLSSIHSKSTFKTKPGQYNDIIWCQNELNNKGIKAIQWNYANQKPKAVTLLLNKSGDSIEYKNDKGNKNVAWIKERRIDFSNVLGVVYGPNSFTFKTQRLKLINEMK